MKLAGGLFLLLSLPCFAMLQNDSALSVKNSASLPPLNIRFFEKVSVKTSQILFRDIAEIRGEGTLIELLRNKNVAVAAHFGLTRSLDADRIYAEYLLPLTNKYQIAYNPIIIKVNTEAKILAKDSLIQLLDSFFANLNKQPGESRQYEIVKTPDSLYIPLEEAQLQISYANQKNKGNTELFLLVSQADKILRKIPLKINIRVFENVYVAKNKINQGTLISLADFNWEIRETTPLIETPLMEFPINEKTLAKQSIAQGRILLPRMLVMQPLIKRGQEVKLLYTKGNVKITTDGISRQDGISGQIISAKNLATQKLVRGKVLAQGLLEPLQSFELKQGI